MKTKTINKKILSSIMIIMLLTTAFLAIFIARQSTTANAEDYDQSSAATFANTRSGVGSSALVNLGSNQPQRVRNFVTHEFQRSSSNFNYIHGHQIGSLIDNRHNLSLRTQSYTITTQRYIATSNPALTILSPSQGGGVEH